MHTYNLPPQNIKKVPDTVTKLGFTSPEQKGRVIAIIVSILL